MLTAALAVRKSLSRGVASGRKRNAGAERYLHDNSDNYRVFVPVARTPILSQLGEQLKNSGSELVRHRIADRAFELCLNNGLSKFASRGSCQMKL